MFDQGCPLIHTMLPLIILPNNSKTKKRARKYFRLFIFFSDAQNIQLT